MYAPTLLRVAAAFVLFFIAWRVWQGAKALAATSFPLVGKTNLLLVQIAAGITALVGVALFLGWETQWAAILSILIAIKLWYFKKQLGPVVGLAPATYILFVVICLSLLLTGAGKFAFDIHL